MRTELGRLVSERRRSLNLLILASRALAWAWPFGLAAALLLALLRLLGLIPAATYPGLAALGTAAAFLAGALAGLVGGLAGRISTAEAARWVDLRLGSEDLLSAALICEERGLAGSFDSEIAQRARSLLPAAASIGLPLRSLLLGSALALGMLVLSLSLALPLAGYHPRRPAAAIPAARPEAAPTPPSGTLIDAGPLEPAAAAALAESLFPGDRERSAQAERALREGRIGAVDELLREAEVAIQDRIDRGVSEPEKERLVREQERIAEGRRRLGIAPQGGTRGPLALRPDQGQKGTGKGEGEGEGGQGGQGRSRPLPGGDEGGLIAPRSGEGGEGEGQGGATPKGLPAPDSGQGAVPPGGGSEGGSGDESRGTKGWGTGEGAPADRGPVTARATGPEADLGLGAKQSWFEFILPGSGAAAPLGSLLPSAARSAEAAVTREGLPLEYREFIRSYFMALSKTARQGASK